MLICFLDTETTSNDPEKDHICEFAAVITDEKDNLKARVEQRINPQKSIVAAAVAVHGITNADVINSPTYEEYGKKIAALMSKVDLVVAHNGDGFDFVIMREEGKRWGCPVEFKATFDTMLQGRFATADGKVPTLGELCWSLDISYDTEKAHRALYDVEVLRECFFRAVALGYWSLPAS